MNLFTMATHPRAAADASGRPEGLASGHFVKLVVQDTGVGMDTTTKERIFEPCLTTQRPDQGSGLASAYDIVRSHAGAITVERALGQGTTFSLYLPATEGVAFEKNTPPAALERGSGTILVVDDEPQILAILTRVLKKIGYDVLTASGSREAVEMVRQHGQEISLVILDMTMPEMSGSQTYDALVGAMPNIKVLVSSGYSMDDQAQDMLARGCRGFLQKPFDLATLSSKLKALG